MKRSHHPLGDFSGAANIEDELNKSRFFGTFPIRNHISLS